MVKFLYVEGASARAGFQACADCDVQRQFLVGSQPMQAKSTNAGEQMEMLVVQISDEGHVLMYIRPHDRWPRPRRQLFPLTAATHPGFSIQIHRDQCG